MYFSNKSSSSFSQKEISLDTNTFLMSTSPPNKEYYCGNCHEPRTSNDIDMKLGPVTKIDKRN